MAAPGGGSVPHGEEAGVLHRSIGGLLVGAGVVASGAWAAYQALLRRPLPRTRGLLTVPGLGAAAEIVRDAWGIPHVRAASLADAYAAQGLVHAQDRLWQLELNRRVASGRLSELFGTIALPADRFLRRIGLRRAAEVELARLAPDSLTLLDAYCAGINAGIAAAAALPLEFRLLRCTPEPWTPLDSLTYAKLLSWTLGTNWETELLRLRLLAAVGPDLAARLEPGYPAGHPFQATAEPGTLRAAADLLADYVRTAELIGPFAPGASNAWAVAAERSATGAPLLASDPHLGLQMPAVWYELHLASPTADVAGASLLGLPGVIIGHNGAIAWGLTAAQVDVQDLYVERLHPDDPTRYEVNGQWHQARVVGEVIRVKDQPSPVIEEVRLTRHGPLVTPLRTTSASLALRWTSQEPDHFVETITGVNQARDWASARAALAQLAGPPLNIVCADRDGTIAYQLVGQVPTRPHGGGLLPVPGWNDEHEWGPPIPFDDLPSTVNPPDGVVITANNPPMDSTYPYYLGHDFFNGYRARRIANLLAERERHTQADMARIQTDVLSLPGLRLQARLSSLDPAQLSPSARGAFDLLQAWDGEMRAESAGAAVYGRLLPVVLRRLFGPTLGDILDEYLGIGQHDFGAMNSFMGRAIPLALDLLDEPDLGGLATALPPRPDTAAADTLLLAAMEETAGDLRRLLGPDVATWRWGALNRVTWRHPLSAVRVLAPLLNRGPYELAGDSETVNYTATLPIPPQGVAKQAWLPGYRLIADLAEPARSVSLLAGGQSGLPGSRHYDDQIGAWRSGRHHALLYDPTAIDRAAIHRLLLLPL
jgi:penicillin amidase